MKTFFYAAQHSRCEIPCSSKRCVCKCLEMLNSLLSIGELVILPGGSRLNCDSSMMMRNGDLIILYAADSYDLDDLIDCRDIFDPFRVVLVFGNDRLLTSFNYHLLKPRFLALLNGNTEKLDAVLWKMNERNVGSAQLGQS